MNKPNCYKCKYRRKLAGDTHSSCNHPAYAEVSNNPFAQMLGIFASVGRGAPIQAKGEGITVRGNPHGIKKGWFNHPFNFDPIWLEECTGYETN